MKKLAQALLFLIVFCAPLAPNAQEYHKRFDSIRSMGMGGASLSTISDVETLLLNPAALANVQESFWDIAAISIDANESGLEFFTEFGIERAVLESSSDYFDFLRKYRGKDIYLRGSVFSGYYGYLLDRGMAWGIVSGISNTYRIRSSDGADISTDYLIRADETLRAGISIPFGKGSYVLGLSYGSTSRVETQGIYAISSAGTTQVSGLGRLEKITGNTLDVGLLYRMPHPMRLRFALAVRDVGGVEFKKGTNEYEPLRQEVTAGISISPRVNRWTYKMALDVRDLTFEYAKENEADSDILKRLHIGIEIGHIPVNRTFNIFALRFGLNQGNPTFGIEGNFGFQKMLIAGFAYYTDEFGLNVGDDPITKTLFYFSFGY